MIVFFVILLVVMIGFSTIGPAALLVLPATGALLVGLIAFAGMLMGAPGSGELFVICAAIVGGAICLAWLIGQAR